MKEFMSFYLQHDTVVDKKVRKSVGNHPLAQSVVLPMDDCQWMMRYRN